MGSTMGDIMGSIMGIMGSKKVVLCKHTKKKV